MRIDITSLRSGVQELRAGLLAADSSAKYFELIRTKAWVLAERIDLGLKACDPNQDLEYLYEFNYDSEGSEIECEAAVQARIEFLTIFNDLMNLAGVEVIGHIQRSYGPGGFPWDGIGNLNIKEISNFWYNWLTANQAFLAADLEEKEFLITWLQSNLEND